MEEMDVSEKQEFKIQKNRDNINKVMHNDPEHLETHFVENPFIKSRERISK